MAEQRRSGCLKKLLIILLIVLILAVVIPITLIYLAIGAYSPQPVPEYNPHDASTVANIITRLARSLVDKDGRVVETAVLKLSQDEVQTLINSAIREANGNRVSAEADDEVWVPYEVIWRENGLLLKYSLPVSTGGIKVKSLITGMQSNAINFRIELSPVVDRGILMINPRSGSAGMIPLPRFALRKAANFLTGMAMANDSVRTTLSAFTRIEPGEDGTLVLMFDPRDVNTVVRILRSAGQDSRDGITVEERDGEDEEDEDSEEEDEETEDSSDEESPEADAVEPEDEDADAAQIQPVL